MCKNSIKIHIKFDVCVLNLQSLTLKHNDLIKFKFSIRSFFFFFCFFVATGESKDTPPMVTCTFLVNFVLTNEIIGFIPQLRVLTNMSIQSLDSLRASNSNVCSVFSSLKQKDQGLGATLHPTTRVSSDPHVAIIEKQ